MKVISFNINGLRARIHQIEALFQSQPDIVGLQEIKVANEQYPIEDVENAGFHSHFHGQKAHYGVANLHLSVSPIKVQKGFPSDDDDAQRRIIATTFNTNLGKPLTFINGYFPQGENRSHETKFPAKEKFYTDLMAWLESDFNSTDLIIITGDFNIAPTDKDIGIKPENAKRWLKTGKCAFLPEEREWFNTLENWGFVDCFRHKYPQVEDKLSWFDYRSKGFEDTPKRGLRIDHFLVTQPLLELMLDTGIDYEIRGMEKPSDHAPIWATFDLELID